MPEETKPTPEQQAIDETVKALGLVEGTVVLDEGETPPPATPTPPAAPAAAPPAPTPPAATPPKDERETLKGFAESERERANEFRRLFEAEQAETKRLRAALGVPTPPTQTPQQLEVRQYLREVLADGLLAEALANVPEEALDKHPSIRKRDMAIYMTREDVAQTRFLGRFEPKQQPGIQRAILPILQARRQASGFQKSYDELYDEYANGLKEQAELVGLTVSEPQPAGATPPGPSSAVPGPTIPLPPSLSGVRGGSGPTTPQPGTLSPEDGRIYGMA